ncbi:MAG: F0F1 ATP synthase subunit gamma [Roseitalea sp.]|jgi:F-type H+-transporting ATPase subunit gamma|uniref:ATP synthase gamma chain n=1 Tax=Oceaniradius stylonematis TaxID=2184161 RepID=A0A3A8ABZ0_9HYPH|nr:F0F1 ATP synthase subunit gamma [Oceaniradius stylonematis]MBO6554069.1 F0F1 ATP synthase subunit gamma [Roseitalea sp.]MBO6952807.1 F0F1 ATP synthase subunit gamma [Rhizobiaceae bacterium]MBV6652103.1 F0F1 ATP synthase subunit gamma [Hoeflea sp.]RNC96737.1 MAG: F0F1 ATP synthase subunit gamma [Oricola sp.]MBO6593154.1 F0F1 ATP synthase subunit gamma [Roseitalea sp.]
MPSLKDLRNRISSVKATQKITKAMQMVAAAKLRRAQEAAEAARPYSQRMGAVLANLAASVDGDDAPRLMAGTGKDDTHLLVCCTAERGLCGGFNSSIAKKVREDARRLQGEGKDIKILCVGKKGFDILKRDFASLIIDRIDLREVKHLAFSDADAIGKKVIALFEEGAFDVCTLYYSEFKSVISQIPTGQQLIPAADETTSADEDNGSIYEYEPDAGAILDDLVPRNISVQIFRALLENAASEQGARMSAMDNATRNAGEMIDKLTLSYNRQRQAQITKELIEIISGAEAL